MQDQRTTPPAIPASAEDVRAVHDALGILYRLVQEGAAGDDSPRVLERYHRAIAATTSIAAMTRKEIGAASGGAYETLEATPDAGERQPVGGTFGERGIRTPDTLAGTPDFESGFSPRAVQLATLAWDLVERDPELAARVAYDLVELDEHDPVACTAVCCNSPLALEVRP